MTPELPSRFSRPGECGWHRNDVGVALPQPLDLALDRRSDLLMGVFRLGSEHRGCTHRTFIERIENLVRRVMTPELLHDACLGLDEAGLFKRTSALVSVCEPKIGRCGRQRDLKPVRLDGAQDNPEAFAWPRCGPDGEGQNPSASQNAKDLQKGTFRMRQVIDAKAYDHWREGVGVERELLGIALTKFDAGKRRARQLDLGAGEIEPDCMSAALGSRGSDVSGTCRHI